MTLPACPGRIKQPTRKRGERIYPTDESEASDETPQGVWEATHAD